MTALRSCLRPGCPELVDTGYCPAHTPARRGLQLDATTRGYGHRWQLLATRYRLAHPVCERCHRRPSALVHHLDGLGPLGPHGYDVANLEAVCHRCHRHAHKQLRRRGIRRGVGTHPPHPRAHPPRHPPPPGTLAPALAYQQRGEQ